MTKTELAALLGISGAMVTKLAKRGMPTDSLERAQRWRKRHLEPGRMKGMRIDTRPAGLSAPSPAVVVPRPMDSASRPRPESRPVVAVELVERWAAHTADALAANDGQAAGMLAHLRELLRALPDAGTDPQRPSMPLRVWLALVDYVLHPESEMRQCRDLHTILGPDGFALRVVPPPDRGLAGCVWLHSACDWDGDSVNGFPDDPEEA